MRRYTIILTPTPELGGYAAEVPALPGVFSRGDTIEDARANAREAIGLHLWGLQRDGDPIPDDLVPIVTSVEAEPLEGRPATDDELAAIDNAPAWDGRNW